MGLTPATLRGVGRHRSDPMGIARLALAGLAALLLLALIVVGARALFAALSDESSTSGSPSPSAPAATSIPTLQIVCAADNCPVFVRVPGGDVLTDRDLTREEQVSYFEPEL